MEVGSVMSALDRSLPASDACCIVRDGKRPRAGLRLLRGRADARRPDLPIPALGFRKPQRHHTVRR